MKLGLLTENGNENIATPKKVCGDVITENSDVIAIFPVYLSKNIWNICTSHTVTLSKYWYFCFIRALILLPFSPHIINQNPKKHTQISIKT